MFLQNVDPKTSEIGFGTIWEVILEGLAPKGPKRHPKAVQRMFKNDSKKHKGWIRGARGTQKAARGNKSAPQRKPSPSIFTLSIHRPSGRYVIILCFYLLMVVVMYSLFCIPIEALICVPCWAHSFGPCCSHSFGP